MQRFLKCETADTVTVRQYETAYAAHILGRVGAIQNWESYRDKGYSLSDNVGLSGVESAFESLLRGTPGTKDVGLSQSGKVVSETYDVMPEPGQTVELTIIHGLQKKVEDALAQYVPQLEGSRGAAMVVLNPKDGSLLASGTFTYFHVDKKRMEERAAE